MGDYWTNAVRHPEDIGTGNIRRTITFDMPALFVAPGVPIGCLEAGARPLASQPTIETAFTAANLVLGTAASNAGFGTAAGLAANVTGYKGPQTGVLTGVPLAADTIIYAFYTGGAAPAAGKAEISIHFENKREGLGIPFPNN